MRRHHKVADLLWALGLLVLVLSLPALLVGVVVWALGNGNTILLLAALTFFAGAALARYANAWRDPARIKIEQR